MGLGQEIWAPDQALLRRVATRTDVGLAGSRWLLVEFGFDLQGTHEGVVREAISSGRGIVIDEASEARALLLSGEPIHEPIVGMGPFVMNSPGEIRQAMIDFESGRMGRL